MSVPTMNEASPTSDNNTPVLRAVGVVKRFGDNVVLRGLDLDVAAHEVVVLLGASGSGKSTLLRCANLLERVDDGQIFLAGEDITDPRANADKIRARIGVVFQHYNLVYRATAIENVLLAAWAKGIGSCWLSAPQRMGFGPAFQRRFAPDKGEFVAAVTLGYPDQQPKMPPRRDGRYLIV